MEYSQKIIYFEYKFNPIDGLQFLKKNHFTFSNYSMFNTKISSHKNIFLYSITLL